MMKTGHPIGAETPVFQVQLYNIPLEKSRHVNSSPATNSHKKITIWVNQPIHSATPPFFFSSSSLSPSDPAAFRTVT